MRNPFFSVFYVSGSIIARSIVSGPIRQCVLFRDLFADFTVARPIVAGFIVAMFIVEIGRASCRERV